MSSKIAIKVENLSKCYQIFKSPRDRLKQFIFPHLSNIINSQPKQYYRESWVLKNISFDVKKGETLGIIGRNGCGKSTLLQMICGTLHPTNGVIQTNGRIAALLELGSGFNPEFSGRENVYLNGALLGLSREEIDAKFSDIAAFADIGDFIEQPVKTYSSGMFVRLAFAIIAHVDADILIIDEALAVGDAVFTQKCMRFLRAFKKKHTLLFVSHDSASVIALCDRVIWLNQGELMEDGEAKDICEKYLSFVLGKGNELNKEKFFEKTVEETSQFWSDKGLYRNLDQTVFKTNIENSEHFGPHGAKITTVRLTDKNGKAIQVLNGGEIVRLRVEAISKSDLRNPIIGFFVKDRLGQFLFGNNTYDPQAENLNPVKEGAFFAAEFVFPMPWLASGDYSIQVALADGNQRDHVQHHWIHDAVIFHSSHDASASGLVGIPMINIALHCDE